MTITFPKFPTKRKQPQPSLDPMVNENNVTGLSTNTAPLTATQSLDMLLNEPLQPNAGNLSEAGLAELKAQLHTQQAIKPKKNKLLPILAALLALAALGAVAYPMYQTMAEEKVAAATPAVTPKPATAVKVTSAPATTANAPASTPTTTTVTAPANPPAPPSSETASPSTKAEDLQKPLMVDNAQSPPSANSPKTSPNNQTAPSANADGKSEAKAEEKSKPEIKSEGKAESKSDNSSSQAPATKPASGKSAMSYDEFIKTSDSTVFIEAPAKQK